VSDQNRRGLAGPGSGRRLATPLGLGLVALLLCLELVAIGRALGEEGTSAEDSSTSSTAPAPPTASTGPDTTATPAETVPETTAPGTTRRPAGPRCTLTKGVTETCESRDPTLDLRVVFNADARQCTFENVVDWGDGTSAERVSVPGGASGTRRVVSHTYHRSARFPIRQQLRLVTGSCRGYEGAYTFSLID
jgi:hypothetical protein